MSCVHSSPGFYPGLLGKGPFFAKIGKETGHLGIKIAGVSCKICEFCTILKKLQLGMGPVFGPCEMRDKALQSSFFFCGTTV